MASFNFFGHRIQLGKQSQNSSPKQKNISANGGGEKKRARQAIKKQPKREVSFEINDISTALTMCKNVDNPDRKKLLQIFSYILKDGHLQSQIKVAMLKVLAEPWMLYANGKPDEAATDLIRKRWLSNIITYILESEWWGYSVAEGDNISPEEGSKGEVILIDREYVSIEKQWILIDGTINGAYLPYADIMEEIDLLEFGKRDDYGCLLQCAYNVIWKFYSRSDYSRCSEKFGMPILSIIADTADDTELDEIERRAATFGTDGYIVGQKGDEIEIKERTGTNSHMIYLDNIKYCDEQISKIINGQGGSSDPKAFVGAANVQERTMEDFTLARLQNIVDEMNEKVLPWLITKGFKIEGRNFDYPALIRERERKINGIPTQTDAPKEPTDTAKEPAKKDTKKPFRK